MSYDAECYCATNDGHLCVFCELESDSRLEKLAKNLAIGAALCRAFELAVEACFTHCEHWFGADGWRPGCGRPT